MAQRDNDDRERGLYQKFNVTRTDGSSEPGQKHDGCPYFVLDVKHDSHALNALLCYAEACGGEHPVLAADLLDLMQKALDENWPSVGNRKHWLTFVMAGLILTTKREGRS